VNKTTAGFTLLCVMIFFGCLTAFAQQQKDMEKKEKRNPAKVEQKNIKANSVQISYKDRSMILGEMISKLGADMLPGAMEPSGPIKVIIFREIAPDNLATAKKWGVKVGGAYIQQGPTKYKYIREVDLSLSDEELAKQFGVKTDSEEEK